MSGRRASNRRTWCCRHQLAYWRRSRAYASRVKPVYPARKPANARRSALVNTGSAMAITVVGDDVVVVIGHLPDPAETRRAGPAAGPSDDDSPHRERAAAITQGQGPQVRHHPGSPNPASVEAQPPDVGPERGSAVMGGGRR